MAGRTGKTNAQRQAAYRTKHLKSLNGGLQRLNTVVEVSAKCKLERLATCYGVTQKAMLEWLLDQAERGALESIVAARLEYSDYYEGRMRMELPVTRYLDDPEEE